MSEPTLTTDLVKNKLTAILGGLDLAQQDAVGGVAWGNLQRIRLAACELRDSDRDAEKAHQERKRTPVYDGRLDALAGWHAVYVLSPTEDVADILTAIEMGLPPIALFRYSDQASDWANKNYPPERWVVRRMGC